MKLTISSEQKFIATIKLTAKDLYRAFLKEASNAVTSRSLKTSDQTTRICELANSINDLTLYLFLDYDNQKEIDRRLQFLQKLVTKYPIKYFIDDLNIRHRMDHYTAPAVTLIIEFSDKSTAIVYTVNQ